MPLPSHSLWLNCNKVTELRHSVILSIYFSGVVWGLHHPQTSSMPRPPVFSLVSNIIFVIKQHATVPVSSGVGGQE